MIVLKTADEIKTMRQAGLIVANVLEELKEKVKPGITTQKLNEYAEVLTKKNGAEPAFKGYHGYPYALCTS
ncbi:MAG: M24 family metallopeptidase, partial [Deltaproteobacteria bacterium]